MSRFFALLLLGGMVGLVVASAFPSGRKVVGEAAMSLTAMVAVGATAAALSAFSQMNAPDRESSHE